MVTPQDSDYQITKQIKLGRRSIDPEFVPLADWIFQEYGVRPLNILYDEKKNRLGIYFEYHWEEKRFWGVDGLGYDEKKQEAIISEFRRQGGMKEGFLGRVLDRVRDSGRKRLFVYFNSFEPIARQEANENIPQEKIDELEKKINHEDLWEISKGFSGATLFFHTEKQAKQYAGSALLKEWTRQYLEVLKPYDEFGYFNEDNFGLFVDSKENFDKNYGGSWFYYYR